MVSESARLYIAETSQILGLLASLMPQAAAQVSQPVSAAVLPDTARPVVATAPEATSLVHSVAGFFQHAAWSAPAPAAELPPAEPAAGFPAVPASGAAAAPPVAEPILSVTPPAAPPVAESAMAAPAATTQASAVAPVAGQGLQKSLSGFFAATSWQGHEQRQEQAPAPVHAGVSASQAQVSVSGTHLSHSLSGFFEGAAWQGRPQQVAAATPAPALAMAGVASSSAPPDDATDSFFEDIDW